jgi:adenine/guanine phosphoribosyltransferase-like PRPP-binding protein
MAATRSPEEIRRSIEANRAELGRAVERLRTEVAVVTDWRRQLQEHKKQVIVGAAVAGFVFGGGIAAATGLLTGRRRRRHPWER